MNGRSPYTNRPIVVSGRTTQTTPAVGARLNVAGVHSPVYANTPNPPLPGNFGHGGPVAGPPGVSLSEMARHSAAQGPAHQMPAVSGALSRLIEAPYTDPIRDALSDRNRREQIFQHYWSHRDRQFPGSEGAMEIQRRMARYQPAQNPNTNTEWEGTLYPGFQIWTYNDMEGLAGSAGVMVVDPRTPQIVAIYRDMIS